MQRLTAPILRLRLGLLIAVAGLSGCIMPGLALAQAPTPPAVPSPVRPVDPLQAAAQAAFEALPEAERRAIQSDLIWAAEFSGAVSGGFGPLTYRAVQVFERSAGTQADGILDANERKLLATAAQKLRDAAKFAARIDVRSQARIGLPDALLTRREDNTLGGSRWQSADQKVTLDTFVSSTETLEQMFERATAASANAARKVTYKLLRPDFFVVTGETPGGKFYRRVVKGPSGVKGFSIGYDKALVTPWDRLVIAIANSFEPFPGTAPSGPAVAALPVSPAVQALPQPSALPPPSALQPRRFAKSATGLVVADGKVLTASAGLAECREPRIGAIPLTDIVTDSQTGLALASVQGIRRRTLNLTGSPAAPLVAMAHGDQGDGTRGLLVIPAAMASGTAAGAFQPGAAGAPVLDRAGRLAGLLISDPGATLQVAGTVIAARHRMADAAMIARFLVARGVTLVESAESAPRPTGQITADLSAAVVAISCSR
jgi:peptidoglycan hydrolase-like protein with peptidoglycan-binding domain